MSKIGSFITVGSVYESRASLVASTCIKLVSSPELKRLLVEAVILNCFSYISAIIAFVDLTPIMRWYNFRCSLMKYDRP